MMVTTAEAQALLKLQTDFSIPVPLVKNIAAAFHQSMLAGLAGQGSSLKMLPSYLGQPTGRERGEFIAIDFGGSNVRVLRVELTGQGNIVVRDRRTFSLKDPGGAHDYTVSQASGDQLFDFIAGKIAELTVPGEQYSLGHTFSFPCRQHNLNQAVLLSWTKEIRASGVEGQDIGKLLLAALQRRNLNGVHPRVILNDTVGTLLTSAYSDTDTDIASICGTGHNTCYLESNHPLTGRPMIVNLESGNFAEFPLTQYDLELDRGAEKPGTQLLEKTAAGRYLGELTRLIVLGLNREGRLGICGQNLQQPYSLRGEDLAALLADISPELLNAESVLVGRWALTNMTKNAVFIIREVAALVVRRSARLVASTFVGVLAHIDPCLQRRHTIAIDGSLYAKMPGYAGEIESTLSEVFANAATHVKVQHSEDGSGAGAAIAAAIANDEQ